MFRCSYITWYDMICLNVYIFRSWDVYRLIRFSQGKGQARSRGTCGYEGRNRRGGGEDFAWARIQQTCHCYPWWGEWRAYCTKNIKTNKKQREKKTGNMGRKWNWRGGCEDCTWARIQQIYHCYSWWGKWRAHCAKNLKTNSEQI